MAYLSMSTTAFDPVFELALEVYECINDLDDACLGKIEVERGCEHNFNMSMIDYI